MGIFDFLKFGNCRSYPDSFAMDRASLYQLFKPALQQQLPQPKTIIVAAHFPAVFFDIQDQLASWEIPYQIITRPLDHQWFVDLRLAEQNAQQAPRLFLSLAEFLIDTEFSGVDSAESPLALMMFDRHPDIRKEDQITSFVENYPNRTEKGYFLSFADVVVQNVVNEALLNLLKTFGAQEQGLITSNMVSKRLEKVLRRHAAKRSAEFEPADTADQWYEVNGRTD